MNLQEQVNVRIATALQKELPMKALEVAKKFGSYSERNYREMIGDITGGIVTKRIWNLNRDLLKVIYSGGDISVSWDSQPVFSAGKVLSDWLVHSYIPGEWETKLEEVYAPIAARKLEFVRIDDERMRKSFAL